MLSCPLLWHRRACLCMHIKVTECLYECVAHNGKQLNAILISSPPLMPINDSLKDILCIFLNMTCQYNETTCKQNSSGVRVRWVFLCWIWDWISNILFTLWETVFFLSVWCIAPQKNDCIVWLLLEEGVTNCSMSWETNDSFLMFNIHMKENSCYMSLGQGQASNTLARKGNHICFYGYRLFSLSSTFTSVTLHTCELLTARTHTETHVELWVWQVQNEEIAKRLWLFVLKLASPWMSSLL